MAGPLPINVKVQGVHEKLSFSQKFSKYCEIVLVITNAANWSANRCDGRHCDLLRD